MRSELLHMKIGVMANRTSSPIVFRPMTAEDLPSARRLWTATVGIELAEGDSNGELSNYLRRNPGMSHVAFMGTQLIGAVLAGHDGRRGLLYHLAVAEEQRGVGVGRKLLKRSLTSLKSEGISRVLILVARENKGGTSFWKSCGWEPLSFANPMGINL